MVYESACVCVCVCVCVYDSFFSHLTHIDYVVSSVGQHGTIDKMGPYYPANLHLHWLALHGGMGTVN